MKSLAVTLILVLTFFISGCNDHALVDPGSGPSMGTVALGLGNAPAEITLVTARLSRDGYEDLTLALSISDSGQSAHGTIEHVAAGRWHLRVEASNSAGTVLYAGETDVDVVPGETSVVNLTLQPASGEVEIHVSWGSNLLVNGSFESGPWVGTYLPLDSGSAAIEGWTVTRGQIDYVTVWQSYDGARSIDLDGSPGRGGIAQTFRTHSGTTYRVHFAISANSHGGPNPKILSVTAAGQSATYSIDTVGRTYDHMNWLVKSWSFIANDTMTTLEFFSNDSLPGFYGPALDDVVVN